MPKIRVREKDLTKNELKATNTNVIFMVDSGSGAEDKPKLLTEHLTETQVTSYANGTLINKIIDSGGQVIVCKSYSSASEYLKDRNQFDVKFLLASEGTSETVNDNNKTQLELAKEIAVARRDCVVVYTKTGLTKEDTSTEDNPAIGGYSADEYAILAENLKETDSDFKESKDSVGKYVLPFYSSELKGTDTPEVSGATLKDIPAGGAYVLAYLESAKTNAEWLAVAGAKRGSIPYEKIDCAYITEAAIDEMQPTGKKAGQVAINPIVKMNPWGVRIWGNRTGYVSQEGDNGLIASSFANIRILLCDLKKALYKAARKYQFEQNSDVLWVNFQSEVNTILEEMVHSYGIAGYRWFKETPSERAKISARLQIVPIEAVEDFDLTIELSDSLAE